MPMFTQLGYVRGDIFSQVRMLRCEWRTSIPNEDQGANAMVADNQGEAQKIAGVHPILVYVAADFISNGNLSVTQHFNGNRLAPYQVRFRVTTPANRPRIRRFQTVGFLLKVQNDIIKDEYHPGNTDDLIQAGIQLSRPSDDPADFVDSV